MDFARPSHLHTLAANDVRCTGVWMDCAVLDQVGTQRATRSPCRRIFRNAESWREHSTEYCRVVFFSRLECEHKDAELVYAGRLTNAEQCPSVKLGCVHRLAAHEWHIHRRVLAYIFRFLSSRTEVWTQRSVVPDNQLLETPSSDSSGRRGL